jgi:hypothetical protein
MKNEKWRMKNDGLRETPRQAAFSFYILPSAFFICVCPSS